MSLVRPTRQSVHLHGDDNVVVVDIFSFFRIAGKFFLIEAVKKRRKFSITGCAFIPPSRIRMETWIETKKEHRLNKGKVL